MKAGADFLSSSWLAGHARSFAHRRNFERSLLFLVVVIIAAVLLDKARDLRSQAEFGAFQYNLGALRVALALAQVRDAVLSANAPAVPINPLMRLDKPLSNYAGDIRLAEAIDGAVPPGAWFHDGLCPCIGYRPFDERRFSAPSRRNLMVFDLPTASLATVSPVLLPAREPYLWWGMQIR